jgi:microcystin degradation protein MlrC
MRIAVGGILHESNTFVAGATRRGAFRVHAGDEIAAAWRGAHHELTGFLEGVEAAGAEPYLTLTAGATPAGPVAGAAYEELTGALLAALRDAPRLDGLLLALHGAMVSEVHRDADGELLRRVRALVGRELPIVVTHDFHANVSAASASYANALLVYRTNPHVDQRDRGRSAAALLARIVRERLRPEVAHAQPPMLWPILHQNTASEPLRAIMAEAERLGHEPGLLNADLAIGYPYADVPHAGPAAVVTAVDAHRGSTAAQRLAALLWDARGSLTIDLPDAAEAVRRALAAERVPVVLVDMGDNIGGGSPGDGTFLLHELLRQGATGWVVTLYDPEAVVACDRAGGGASVRLDVGAKTDDQHGPPLAVTGTVRSLHDGRFIETQARHGGQREWDQGRTAVLDLPADGTLVLNSRRTPPFSLEQLRSLGIAPQTARILVVKAAVAFRAAYEPIAGTILEVDTPGVTAVSPLHFTYHSARRPLWPLDAA